MRDTLTDLEFDLLMLVAPVLRKLADGDERQREVIRSDTRQHNERHDRPRRRP